jgi:hypothetical protein
MEIAHQLCEIEVLLTRHGLIAVLKQPAMPFMAASEPDGLAGQ